METAAPPATAAEPAERFGFGANWQRFLETVDERRIAAAESSLAAMLGPESLQGKRFLDAGCGSGLMSLAAARLGAKVVAFDADPQSVACAEELKRRFAPAGAEWDIQRGSLLDEAFLAALGDFDVVYCWGVVHHTGAMWDAIDLVRRGVASDGLLWLAVYNDQGPLSRRWWRVKRLYNRLPALLRPPYVVVIGGGWGLWRLGCRLFAMSAAMLRRLVSLENPMSPVTDLSNDFRRQSARGMHWWYDLVDWIGGWPFEAAKPEEVFRFLRDRGFELVELRTCGGGLGCNEFLFRRR